MPRTAFWIAPFQDFGINAFFVGSDSTRSIARGARPIGTAPMKPHFPTKSASRSFRHRLKL